VHRIQLPGFWPLAYTTATDGSFALLGGERGVVTTLVTVTPEGGHHIEPLAYIGDAWLTHQPTLLALPAGGWAVVVDPDRLFVHTVPGTHHEVPIGHAEAMKSVDPAPRLYGGTAVGAAGRFDVVLAHGSLLQEPRYAATLTVTDSQEATWSAPWSLEPADFPVDPSGGGAGGPSVTLTSTLRSPTGVLVCSSGSRLASLPRYGSDFFSCVEVDGAGRVTRRLWERSGWLRQPGKQGIYGRFTGDGRYCVLTPAFAAGDWKGRARVLSLSSGAELEPVLPRGLSKAQLLDHHPVSGWWLLAGVSPNAEIVIAGELELRAVEA
jgi:hypothetical protein